VEQLMDQSIPQEDIQHYRRALIESSGVELLQVLIILIHLLEEEKEEPSRTSMKVSLSPPIVDVDA
jgi:hypothetical protein